MKLKLSLHSANLVQEKQAKSESGESRSDQQIVANKVKSSLERERSRERERESEINLIEIETTHQVGPWN